MSEEIKTDPEIPAIFELDFSTFVLSLNTSALIHFGDIPDPGTKERTVSVPAAKHTLQILEILKDKTTGNLDEQETKLLDDVLFNLRMKFIRLTESDEPKKS